MHRFQPGTMQRVCESRHQKHRCEDYGCPSVCRLLQGRPRFPVQPRGLKLLLQTIRQPFLGAVVAWRPISSPFLPNHLNSRRPTSITLIVWSLQSLSQPIRIPMCTSTRTQIHSNLSVDLSPNCRSRTTHSWIMRTTSGYTFLSPIPRTPLQSQTHALATTCLQARAHLSFMTSSTLSTGSNPTLVTLPTWTGLAFPYRFLHFLSIHGGLLSAITLTLIISFRPLSMAGTCQSSQTPVPLTHQGTFHLPLRRRLMLINMLPPSWPLEHWWAPSIRLSAHSVYFATHWVLWRKLGPIPAGQLLTAHKEAKELTPSSQPICIVEQSGSSPYQMLKQLSQAFGTFVADTPGSAFSCLRWILAATLGGSGWIQAKFHSWQFAGKATLTLIQISPLGTVGHVSRHNE